MEKTFRRYIKPEQKKLEKLCSIYIRYDFNRTSRTLINTGIKIQPILHWDDKRSNLKKTYPNYENAIKQLEILEHKISSILLFAKEKYLSPTPEFLIDRLKQDINEDFKTNRQTDLFLCLDSFIKDREDNLAVSPHAIRDYKSFKKHLLNFQKYSNTTVTFLGLNLAFYEKFINYLSYHAVKPDGTKGLKLNSVGKQIKNLKVFYNDRKRKDNLPDIDLSFFKKKTETVDHIYLSEEELLHIKEFNLTDYPELIEVRDVLLFGCYTGLRYSDINSLQPYHFKKIVIGNTIETAIFKTQRKVNEKVEIAVIHLAKNVAEKYDYNLPKMHMNDFNEKVKLLGNICGIDEVIPLTHKIGNKINEVTYKKYELMASHICRRSFATNMYLRGIDPEIIMTNTGHKSLKTLLAYIKISRQQKAFKLYDYFKSSSEVFNSKPIHSTD